MLCANGVLSLVAEWVFFALSVKIAIDFRRAVMLARMQVRR